MVIIIAMKPKTAQAEEENGLHKANEDQTARGKVNNSLHKLDEGQNALHRHYL